MSSAGMCALQSPWSVNVRCSPNHGSCQLNGECFCHQGYIHDLSFYRYRDCKVPKVFLLSTDIVLLILSFLTLIYSLYFFRASKALARSIIKVVIYGDIVLVILCIIRLGQSNYMSSFSLLALHIVLCCMGLSGYLSAYSLAGPLCKLSRTPIERIQNGMKTMYISFRAFELVPVLISFVFNDANDPSNDDGWNKCLAAFYILIGVELASVGITIVINGHEMILAIEDIMKDVQLDDARSTSRANYLKRVRRFLKFFFYYAPAMTCVLCSQPIIHLTTSYIPFCFVIFFLTVLCLPLYATIQTIFAVSEKTQISNTPENRLVTSLKIINSSTNPIVPIGINSVKDSQS